MVQELRKGVEDDVLSQRLLDLESLFLALLLIICLVRGST